MHLTLGILRTSQAVSHALSFFWLDGFAVPAPAQVTQTVRAQNPTTMKPTRFQSSCASHIATLILAFLLVSCNSTVSTESLIAASATSTIIEVPSPTSKPPLDAEISNLLSSYGWTIKELLSTERITLPDTFQHFPGDFPYTIYWAYNNEFSKAIGLDLAPYLGKSVQASLYLLNEPLPQEFYPITTAYAVIVTVDDKIIGAWIDKGRHYGFASSLDKKDFNEIVGQSWSQWLVSSGIVVASNELEKDLSKKSPEEIIEIYYTALNEHDFHMMNAVRSRRSLSADLFVNKETQALFNHQDDKTITMWLDNIESAKLISIESINNPLNCLPVYGALVDFQFTHPQLPTIPEGGNLRFMVLNEEIKGLGWRIEEVNTAPGVSERLCAP